MEKRSSKFEIPRVECTKINHRLSTAKKETLITTIITTKTELILMLFANYQAVFPSLIVTVC
jgi:hypothetical protein